MKSFAGDDRKPASTPHYQTFPNTKPPRHKGRPLSHSLPIDDQSEAEQESSHAHDGETPLPAKQLVVLAIIALCEQTALNSISPYLPRMASRFPGVDEASVGIYVGTIASAFALAQFATVYFWGWLSDHVGRKPVILIGTTFTAMGFMAFGFCRTLWQAILVQALIGLMNGNQGVISTCLGEITDRSNQSKAFTYLPVIYGLGGITGPILGGLLTSNHEEDSFPFLLPNLVSAVVLLMELMVTMLLMEESLDEAKKLPSLGNRLASLFSSLWNSAHSKESTLPPKVGPAYTDTSNDEHEEDSDDSASEVESTHLPALLPQRTSVLPYKEILNRDTLLLLGSYFVFQLSNVAFNSLYPVFGNASPPTGRDLSPEEIGVSLSLAGVATIIFQIGLFGRLREEMGNKITYRVSLGGLVLAHLMMPIVGYKGSEQSRFSNEKIWLWIELGGALLVKTIASVAGLTSALLLITNSASNHSVLGRLNGLAQTLSAAGRSCGPFLAGSLFSLATRVRPKGEALAFGVFGAITFLGFILAFGIHGNDLEAQGWDEEASDDTEETNERNSLL